MSLLKKLPSYQYIITNLASTIKRFPFAVLAATVGTLVAVYIIDRENELQVDRYINFIVTAGISVSWFIALQLLSERYGWDNFKKYGSQFVVLILTAGYYFSLPLEIGNQYIHLYRSLFLFLAGHALIAFGPFFGSGRVDRFWQFNKSLFIRLLLSALYSGALYIGLIIALASADKLFGADINPIRYMQLWVIIVGIFYTLVCLAGIPKDLKQESTDEKYPIGLKVFTQYILLPLVALYFAILISYEAKIILTWNWPKGWVSELVLWYAVVGILSLLLLYPLQKIKENRWIVIYSRYFFLGLVPLLFMLTIAIIKRVSDYGITVNRYLVISMSIGMVFLVIYFMFSKAKDIRTIPIVIFILAITATYGPLSADSISKNSQLNRLKELIATGNTQEETLASTQSYRSNNSSIIRYLNEFHGYEIFSDMIDDNTMEAIADTSHYDRPKMIASALGIEYATKYGRGEPGAFYIFTNEPPQAQNIQGYDFIIQFSGVNIIDGYTFSLDKDSCTINYDTKSGELEIYQNNDSLSAFSFNIEQMILDRVEIFEHANVPAEDLIFEVGDEKIGMKFYLRRISGTMEDDNLDILTLDGNLLIDFKE